MANNLKPSRPPTYPPNPELRARANAARAKMLQELAELDDPSPEELGAHVVQIGDQPTVEPSAVPVPVQAILMQLVAVIEPLDSTARAKTLRYISTELARRLAS